MRSSWLYLLSPAFALAQTSTATLPPWQTGVVTPDGTCGGDTGFVCSPTWGACCSKDGRCGRSSAFCGEGCQLKAGNCNALPPTQPEPPGPGSTSPDGSCGGTQQFKCTGSPFGDCCSSSGYCGETLGHCGNGCQEAFGTCGPPNNVTSDGQCGANGKICIGSGFGDCCSSGGWCGDASDHCGAGCQSGFGECSDPDAGDISTDGSCGKNGKTCKGSAFGDCCSAEGFCGKTDAHCQNCQPAFGTCSETDISTDGSCGKNGKTCKGSTFGDCCSSSGYCGKTSGHCGAGCNAAFGICDSGSDQISTDGMCGSKNGKTCKGTSYGDCCSASGYCGKTTDHCGTGCNPSYGTCSAPSNISTDGKCSTNGKTCKGSTFGDCCSASNYCGKTTAHCKTGCQSKFGTCS